jgi:hypothetical protein
MSLLDVAGAMNESERRLPGPTPSGGAYGIVRYLDANGQYTNAEDAVSIEFSEYDKWADTDSGEDLVERAESVEKIRGVPAGV